MMRYCACLSRKKISTQLAILLYTVSIFTILVFVTVIVAVSVHVDVAMSKIFKEMLNNSTRKTGNQMVKVVAKKIDEGLFSLSDSVALTTAKQMDIFITGEPISTFSSINKEATIWTDLPLKKLPTYPDFAFESSDNQDCRYVSGFARCPSDFGRIDGSSRLKNVNGSMTASSVYLLAASETRKLTIAEDGSTWQQILDKYPQMNSIINNTAHIDADWNEMYSTGPDSTLMFYGAVKYQPNNTETHYSAMMRTYPGIRIQHGGDPTTQSWFSEAKEDDIHLMAYHDSMTNKKVINLSSKKTTQIKVDDGSTVSDGTVTSVAAVISQLSDLRKLILDLDLGGGGYATLVQTANLRVLVDGNKTVDELYDEGAKAFRTLQSIRPNQQRDFKKNATHGFTYTDARNRKWHVAHAPVFNGSLHCLVYYQLDLLPSFYKKATRDHSISVVLTIGVGGLATFVTCLMFIFYFHQRISAPLALLGTVCADLIALQAKEKRDYEPLIALVLTIPKGDEIGTLADKVLQLLNKLVHQEKEKEKRIKYPSNPLFQDDSVEKTAKPRPLKVVNSFCIDPALTATMRTHSSSLLSIEASSTSIETSLPNLGSSSQLQPPTRSDFSLLTSQTEIPIESKTRKSALWKIQWCLSVAFMLVVFIGLMTTSLVLLKHRLDQNGEIVDQSKIYFEDKQDDHLNALANAKGSFITTLFDRVKLDIAVFSRFYTSIADEKLVRRNPDGTIFLSNSTNGYNSWSLDGSRNNSYSYNGEGAQKSEDLFSGYMYEEAAGCWYLRMASSVSTNCKAFADKETTKRTALLDIKMRAYASSRSYLDSIQTGDENTTLTRYYPYQWKPYGNRNGKPECFVQDTTAPDCEKCQGNHFSTYNPHCRNWYVLAKAEPDPKKLHFLHRRKARMITGVTPIRSNRSVDGKLKGVLAWNINVQTLADAVTKLQREGGYSFVMKRTKDQSSVAILHPCPDFTVKCIVENSERKGNQNHRNLRSQANRQLAGSGNSGSSQHTWIDSGRDVNRSFEENILKPILSNKPREEIEKVFSQDSTLYHVNYANFKAGTMDMIFFAVQSQDTFEQPLNKVEENLKSEVTQRISLMFICTVIVLGIIVLLICFLSNNVVMRPISQLVRTFDKLIYKNQGEVKISEGKFTSSDVLQMTKAFGGVVVALRFSDRAYIGDDIKKAKKVFSDALTLFRMYHSDIGVGAALNNLGIVEITLGEFDHAKIHLEKALTNAQDALRSLQIAEAKSVNRAGSAPSAREIHARKVLSNRKTNYAALLVAMGTQDSLKEAQAFVKAAIEEDQAFDNIEGISQKRITLGQALMQAGRMDDAKAQFDLVSELVSRESKTSDDHLHSIDQLELEIARQSALVNRGIWHKNKKEFKSAIELLRSGLVCSLHCDVSLTRTALFELKEIAEMIDDNDLLIEVVSVMSTLCPGPPKDIMFLLDYSGSMAGRRIQAAVEAMLLIYDTQINKTDSIACMTFNSKPVIVFPFQPRAAQHRLEFCRLDDPSGGTAMYDAISLAVDQAAKSPNVAHQKWLIAVSDGDDNRSKISIDALVTKLRDSCITGLCIVALGNEMDTDNFEQLAKATDKGQFAHALSASEILRAFGQVTAHLMQNRLMLEEF